MNSGSVTGSEAQAGYAPCWTPEEPLRRSVSYEVVE